MTFEGFVSDRVTDLFNGLRRKAVSNPDRQWIQIPIEEGPEKISLSELYGWRAGEYRVLSEPNLGDVPLMTNRSAAAVANFLDEDMNGWGMAVYVHAVPSHGDARKGLGTLKTAAEFIADTDKGVHEEGGGNKHA